MKFSLQLTGKQLKYCFSYHSGKKLKVEPVIINLEAIVFYWFVSIPPIIQICSCGYDIYLLTHIDDIV